MGFEATKQSENQTGHRARARGLQRVTNSCEHPGSQVRRLGDSLTASEFGRAGPQSSARGRGLIPTRTSRLAARTKMAAALTDNNASNLRPATQTLFSFPPIHSQPFLIRSPLTLSVQIVLKTS